MNQTLLVDELDLPDASSIERRTMDTSSVLLGLMQLARRAESVDGSDDSFEGIICKGVMRSLLSALQFRDSNTVQHSRRVSMLAVGMGQHLGWDGRHLKALEVAALLHDVGKIGVPDNILLKPGKLSPDEAELMALHFNIGVDVLQACRVDKQVLEIVSQSHCPHGNAGSEIHLGARILSVADAYDALCTPQVYRDGKSHDEAMIILQDAAGKQFDGNVVSALGRWIDTNGRPTERHASGPSHHYLSSGMGGLRPEDSLEANQLGNIFSYLYVLESLYDGFYLVDSDLRIIVWNRGIEKFLGQPASQMVGQPWSKRMFSYADRFGEIFPDREIPLSRVIATGMPMSPAVRVQNADGNWMDVEVQSVPLLDADGRLQGVAEIFRDLSRNSCRPREFQELRLAASRDALTSVANRGELEMQMANMLREYEQSPTKEPFCLIFLDVDFFKRINDTFGHTVGDQVLVDVARMLQNETYSGETVGRYGGEEFVVLCPGTTLEAATRRAERLRTVLQKSKIAGIEEFPVTASFGATEVEPGDSVESLLRRADKALYTAKGGGRNRTVALTNRDLLDLDNRKKEAQQGAEDPFRFKLTFHACVAADMVVHKLAGFVDDEGATIVSVKPNHVVLHLGSRGLLPFWGGSDHRRPVEIELDIGAQTAADPTSRRASTTVAITARVRPLGWIRDANVFQARAKKVVKQLRSFFAAD